MDLGARPPRPCRKGLFSARTFAMNLDESRLTYETLDARGVREAASQTYSAWDAGRTLEQHIQRVFDSLAYLGDDLRYVGLRDERGRLVASLKFYTVALQTPQGIVRTLGIGAVFVPETRRGKGYGQGIVQAAMKEAKTLGYEAALLYSDIAPGFYARLGFVAFAAWDWSAEATALPMDAPLDVRPAAAHDVERMRAWYHADGAGTALFPARSPNVWRFFRSYNGAGRDLVLCDGSQEVGYVNVRSAEWGLCLLEWAAPEVEPSRIWATVRRLAGVEGQSRVYGWLRPDRRAAWMAVRPRPDAIPMVAPLADSVTATTDMAAFFGAVDHF